MTTAPATTADQRTPLELVEEAKRLPGVAEAVEIYNAVAKISMPRGEPKPQLAYASGGNL